MFDLTKISLLTVALAGGVQGGKHAPKTAVALDVKLSLGRPVQVDRITIIPIESTVPLARDQYLTLAEATKFGMVEIVEVPGQEQVNSLEVRNKGKLPILLFAGELLLGGKQDRIVAKDSIVPAHDRRDVPVFCVEHGRWDGKPAFQSGDTLVTDEVRSVALSSQDQGQVWAKVADSNARVAASPATGTFRGTLNSPKTRAESTKALLGLNSRFVATSRTVGVICCINGKIESADIYANPSLFNQSRSKLFHSYALDAAMASKGKSSPADMKKCSAFLAQIVTAKRQKSDSSGYGNTYLISNGALQGYEAGNTRFAGGIVGGSSSTGTVTISAGKSSKAGSGRSAGAGEGGFSHGTYKPKSDKGGG